MRASSAHSVWALFTLLTTGFVQFVKTVLAVDDAVTHGDVTDFLMTRFATELLRSTPLA